MNNLVRLSRNVIVKMDFEYTSRLEEIRGLKDVKYIVYRCVHQLKLRKCFDEMYEYLEWDEERSFWITRYKYWCDRDVSLMRTRGLFNYRKLGIHQNAYCGTDFLIRNHLRRNGRVISEHLRYEPYKSIYVPKNYGLYSKK